jgi:hypothetical protein
MSFKTVSGALAAAVAQNGTFTQAYPAGSTKGDFVLGAQHKLAINGLVLLAPKDFSVALGNTSVTITYLGATALPASSLYTLQLDIVGPSNVTPLQDGPAVNGSKPVVGNVVPFQVELVNLGTPAAKSATAVLNAVAATGSAGTLITLATPVTFDVPRNFQIVSSNAGDTTQVVTVFGNDINGNAMSEAATLNGTTAVTSAKKAFAKVTGYKYSANLAGNLSLGTHDKLGLPVALVSTALILKELQDGAAATAGTSAAADAATATTTTGDVRGTYIPNAAPDAAKSYALLVALPDLGYQGAPQA